MSGPHISLVSVDFAPAGGFARIVFVIDSQILLFGAQTGQADLRVGGLQEFDSVSTRHPQIGRAHV